MTPATDEELLNRRVHTAIDPVLPRSGVEERVLHGARERIARGESASRIPWMPLQRGLGGALIALAVIAVLGGALGVTLSLRNRGTPAPAKTPSTVSPTGPPVTPPAVVPPSPTPASALDFGSSAVSFASASDGWTLGSACDVQNNCRFGVYRTTDGGARWTSVRFPVSVAAANFSLNIQATSASDAWIWGTSNVTGVLAVTHDAGVDWQTVDLGNAIVGSVAVDGGTAWAITTCSTAAPCVARVLSQPEHGGAWSDLGDLPAAVRAPIDNNSDLPLAQLVRVGTWAWVLDANQSKPALVRTENNARTWASLPVPCPTGATMLLGAASATHLMLACANEGAWPAPQEVWTSSDGGSAWVLRSRAGYNMGFAPPEPNVGSINSGGAPIELVVLSSTTAWMANDREDNLVTHDDGVTWSHAALPPDQFGGAGGAEGIGFVDALHGWTFVPSGLWTTSDGGVTWHEQPGITVPGF
jgi:hypothetical protein